MSAKSVTLIGPQPSRVEVGVDAATTALLVKVVNPGGGGGGGGDVNLVQYGGVAVGAGNALHVRPGTGAIFPASQSGSWTVSVDNFPAIQGVAQASAWIVDQGTSPWVVSGTVAVSGSVAVTQSTSPWVVSGTVSAAQSGAWTVASTQSGAWSVGVTGTVAVTQSGAWSVGQSGSWTVTAQQPSHANLNAQIRIQDGDGLHLADVVQAFEVVAEFTQKGLPPMFLCSPDPAAASGAFNYGYINEDGEILAHVTGAVSVTTGALDVLNVGGFGTNHLGKQEDTAHVTGDVGVMALGVQNDAGAALSSAAGDYTPIAVSSTGAVYAITRVMDGTSNNLMSILHTAAPVSADVDGPPPMFECWDIDTIGDPVVIDGTFNHAYIDRFGHLMVRARIVDQVTTTVSVIIPGTAASNLGKAEDAVHASGDVGVMSLAVRADTAAATAANGDYHPLLVDASGRLHVSVGAQVPGTGATNLGKAEDAVHASGDTGVMMLAVRNDAGTTLAGTNGDYAPLGVDANGHLRVTITGQVPGTSATQLGKAEDAVAASGDTGVAVLAVRRDTLSSDVSAAGDYATLKVDAVGALWVRNADMVTLALSGSTRGRPIQITGTSSGAAVTLHTATTTAGQLDRVFIDLTNTSDNAIIVTIEFGTTGTGNELYITVPPRETVPAVVGMVIGGAATDTIRAYAGTGSVVNAVGRVERLS